jgi:hypothetical protein
VFTRSGSDWTQQGSELLGAGEVNAPNSLGSPSDGGEFGYSTALSADGSTGLFGGPLDNQTAGAVWPFANTAPAASVPGAPTGVSAVAGDGQATVSFNTPVANGSAITRYTVTASPGGAHASGAGSPTVVTGLSNGTRYTFTVTATTAVGAGPASSPSNAVTLSAGSPRVVSHPSVSGGTDAITVTLSCPAGGASCAAVTVVASVTEHLTGGTPTAVTAAKRKHTTKQVVVASGHATLAAGSSKKLTLKLNGAGRKLLAKFHKLAARVTVSSAGRTLATATAQVRSPKPKKKKHKK